MIQIDKVNKYIEDLKFKKKPMGGVDELDALNHMKNICDIYEEELNKLKTGAADAPTKEDLANKDEIIETLKEKVRQINDEKEKYREMAMDNSASGASKEEVERLQDRINVLIADNESLRRTAVSPAVVERKDMELAKMQTENNELKQKYMELEESFIKAEQELKAVGEQESAKMEEAEAIKAEYEQKYSEIKDLSEYILQVKKDARDRAEAQANQIIDKANMDAKTVREGSLNEKKRIEGEIEAIKQAKDNMKRSVLDTMQRYDELLRKISSEMDNE